MLALIHCLYSSWWAVSLPLIVCFCWRWEGSADVTTAGWAWKRPFVGSWSTSSPCAWNTHSHRGHERGMAPFRLPHCPLNWRNCKTGELLDQTRTFGSLKLKKVELTKSPRSQRGGKKTWRRSKEKVGRLCRTAGSFCFRKEREEKEDFWLLEGQKKTKLVSFNAYLVLGVFILFLFYRLLIFFLLLDTCSEQTSERNLFWARSYISSGKGRKANENVGDMPEIGGV